jgi:hypothetical protein
VGTINFFNGFCQCLAKELERIAPASLYIVISGDTVRLPSNTAYRSWWRHGKKATLSAPMPQNSWIAPFGGFY